MIFFNFVRPGSSDLGGKNKNNYHSPNDALLQPESDKVFYENLPFHGMQNPPNKVNINFSSFVT